MIHADAVLAGVFAIAGYVVAHFLIERRARKDRAHQQAVAAADRTYERRRDACVDFLTAVDDAWRTAQQRWHEGERPLPAHEITAPVYAAQVPLDIYTSAEVADAGRSLAFKLYRLCEGYGGVDEAPRWNDYNEARETFVRLVRREVGAERSEDESR